MFSASKTAGPSGYNISRSVRLRSSASAYFSRTFGTPTNNTVWTFSSWVKRGLLSTNQTIMGGSTYAMFGFRGADDLLHIWNNAGGSSDSPVGVRRDPSAWCHICYVSNGTTITGYFNNTQFVSWTGTITNFNSAGTQYIGRDSSGDYFDGYLTEINFVDGQALTPSSFGSTNATTGVWQPAKYTGTYGNNGFYLNFSDNSAATAAAIGKDYSGNGNNWTPNNISVTAGTTYDSMIDVPTPYADGSTNRGNYAVWNAISLGTDATLTSGNLDIAYGSAATRYSTMATFGMTTGKWYWEVTVTASSATPCNVIQGITNAPSSSDVIYYPGNAANGWGYWGNGTKYANGVNAAYGASYTTNDVIGFAFDADAGSITCYKNGVSQGVMYSGLAAGTYYPAIGDGGSTSTFSTSANFGQRPFTYTPPSGFKALNTYNLPASTITNGGKYMAATLYTGTGASQSVTNAGSFKPDLVWVKSRSAATDHKLTDSVRGTTKALISDTTGAETTDTNGLTAFGSAGFTVGSDTTYNNNTATYVGWQWQAGQGSTSSNTSGSITSTVSVNATAGFSIVTYTGNGSSNQTIGHGLGVTPAMIIVKARTQASATNWRVWHQSLSGSTYYLGLNQTAAQDTSSTVFNGQSSTTFTVGNDPAVNANTYTFVAYCWAAVAGYSAFGSYTGNGSTNGVFVYTGLRPRFLMIKRTDAAGNNWVILDTSRDTYNAAGLYLYPNLSAAEDDYRASTGPVDILSNGFKQRSTLSNVNASGATYIYAAFAENPFANALAR